MQQNKKCVVCSLNLPILTRRAKSLETSGMRKRGDYNLNERIFYFYVTEIRNISPSGTKMQVILILHL